MGEPNPDTDNRLEESSDSDEQRQNDYSDRTGMALPVTRRMALGGLLGLGLISSSASAEKLKEWKRDRDAQGNDLLNLGALTMQENSTEITDFTGPNLGIGDGKLSAAQWNKDVDAGGNDLTNLGSANASEVNADTLSDNGGGDVVLGTRFDAAGNTLRRIGRLAMLEDNTRITRFTGDNLSVDGSNVLNAQDTRTNVSDDGSTSVENVENIDFGSNLGVTDNSDGSVTVDAADETTESGAGASVYLSDFQTIQQDNFTTVAFDEKVYDDNGEFDTGTHEFTPDVDGTYQVESNVLWPGTGVADIADHHIVVNGDEKAATLLPHDTLTTTTVSKVLRLKAGDSVSIRVIFATGSSSELDLEPGENSTYATFTRLG